MTRKLFLLIILLCALPLASSEETKVHDAWHTYQDFFQIENDYYEVINAHVIDDGDLLIKTMVKRNQESAIISGVANEEDRTYYLQKEVCAKKGYYRFCVVNVSLYPEKGARADEDGQYHYGTQIRVYEEAPEEATLTIARSTKQRFYYGEDERVTVTLTNKGTKTAENVQYTETIGPGLSIIKYEGFTSRAGRKLQADIPAVYAGKTQVLTYWVMADDYVNSTTLTANITYDNPAPATLNNAQTVTIPWPYTATLSFKNNEIKRGGQTALAYTVTNNDQSPMSIDFSFIHAPIVEIVSAPSLTAVTKNKLSHTGTLAGNTSITFAPVMTSTRAAAYDLLLDLSLAVNGHEYNLQEEALLRVNDENAISYADLRPSLTLSKETMRSGETLTIALYLYNKDTGYALFDVNGWVGAEFFNETYTYDRILASDYKNALFKTYYPPAVTQPTTIPITVKGTYETPGGQKHEFSASESVLVLPQNMSVILTQKTSKEKLSRGEEVTITVTVKNLADSGQYRVRAYDDYDRDLELTFGKSNSDVYLYGGEQVEMYVYKLRVPFAYYEPSFNITSDLAVEGQPLLTFTKQITVLDPLDPGTKPVEQEPAEETEETTEPETDEETTPEEQAPQEEQSATNSSSSPFPEEEEEKKGPLARLIRVIANFFAGFFS